MEHKNLSLSTDLEETIKEWQECKSHIESEQDKLKKYKKRKRDCEKKFRVFMNDNNVNHIDLGIEVYERSTASKCSYSKKKCQEFLGEDMHAQYMERYTGENEVFISRKK